MNSEAIVVFSFRVCLSAYLAGFASSIVFVRRERVANFFGFSCAGIGGLAGCAASLCALAYGATPTLAVWPFKMPLFTFTIHLDALACFFILVISLLTIAISIYSQGYVTQYYGIKNVSVLAAFFNLLVFSNTLVFCADNAAFFLITWEMMALVAYLLVSFEHEESRTRQAGFLFFAMSHIGTGCLILGFLLLFRATGNFDFLAFHFIGASLSPVERNAAFLLFLIGFGVKAGIIPLHIWLPEAHPVAPSNVSALMSGVLIKSGVYGLVRVLWDFMGTPPVWWGITILLVGSVSALLGVLYALVEHNLKRLLAFHSIENIGIILMGLGASLMFSSFHHPVLAALALMAGLYHTINHACFKALLFLGAGAVLRATKTKSMEELGGLIKKMPWTAFFFLLGSVAISGLPPLNGFVSEWLTYQALLQGFSTTERLVRLIFPIAGALLALTGALAAACFVKAVGISFLAMPRSPEAESAEEAPSSMLLGMLVLALACVMLGLFPSTFLPLLDPICQGLLGQAISARVIGGNGWMLTALGLEQGSISTLGMVSLFLALLPLPWVSWLLFSRKAPHSIGETWDCGLDRLTPQMEYTATAYSKPLRMIFRALYRPRRQVEADFEVSRYFTKSIRFETHIEPTFEKLIYEPLHRAILRVSQRLRWIQAGSLNTYLLYIFITLLLLLLWEKIR